jgi:hypothetical protein
LRCNKRRLRRWAAGGGDGRPWTLRVSELLRGAAAQAARLVRASYLLSRPLGVLADCCFAAVGDTPVAHRLSAACQIPARLPLPLPLRRATRTGPAAPAALSSPVSAALAQIEARSAAAQAVRAFAWHALRSVCAAALADDSVHLFDLDAEGAAGAAVPARELPPLTRRHPFL